MYLDTSALAKRYLNAVRLIGRLDEYALRTLDALHLACAWAAGAKELATADRAMAAAAEALGMDVERFW